MTLAKGRSPLAAWGTFQGSARAVGPRTLRMYPREYSSLTYRKWLFAEARRAFPLLCKKR